MRPWQGTDEVGDSISMAVVAGGFLVEAGPPRKYDPVNPCDIAPVEDKYYDAPVFQATFVGSPMVQIPEAARPMTMHQRLYLWPPVGPVNIAGVIPSVSIPPAEVPSGQDVWPVQPTAAVSPFSVEIPKSPEIEEQDLDTESIIPQRGMSLREGWTLYRTMPWATTVFTRNISFEGDSKRYVVTGTTFDRLGTTPVAGCRVLALSMDRLGLGKADSVVDETVSDGSGNYSLVVTGRDIQILAYLPGSPDRAGVSRDDVVSQATNIYLRDPIAYDVPSGGGAGISRGRAVNAGG